VKAKARTFKAKAKASKKSREAKKLYEDKAVADRRLEVAHEAARLAKSKVDRAIAAHVKAMAD